MRAAHVGDVNRLEARVPGKALELFDGEVRNVGLAEPRNTGDHCGEAERAVAAREVHDHLAREVERRLDVIARERLGAWAYALTGGYSKPQLYPAALYPLMSGVDKVAAMIPQLFALRALIVLRA